MAAEILSDLSRATDSNSDSLTGATWNFYDVGTLTPRAVYSDASLSTSLGAVVTADSGGQFVPIYLDGSYEYRGILKDFDGNTIKDIPKINPALSALLASTASSKGAGLVGFSHAATYAASTVGKKLQQIVDPRDAPYNAAGDGATDDYTPLASALASGKKVWLEPGVTYAFGTQLAYSVDNSGFIGGGKLLMLTGTGEFDAADYTGTYSTNRTGILIDGITNPVLDAIIEMETNASVRTCNAVTVVSCTNPNIKVEAYGFKEAKYGIVEANSNTGGVIDANVHDCGADSTSLGSMQITGLAVDGNRVGGVNSTGVRYFGRFKDIRLGAAAGAAYGEQTDGLNIQTVGYSGAICDVIAENVGEAFDCFGDHVIANVNAKDVVNYGVKLIHGASFCQVTATVDGCGIYGAVIGSDSTTKSCNRNNINLTVDGVGTVSNPTSPANQAAFATDGSSAAYQPTNNTITVNGRTNGATATHAVLLESGSGNLIEADCTLSFGTQYGSISTLSRAATTTSGSPDLTSVNTNGLVAGQTVTGTGIPADTVLVSVDTGAGTAVMSKNATASGAITMSAPLYGNIIRRRQGTYIKAYIGTATTVAQNADVPFDTELTDRTNEFNPSTYTATVRCDGRYEVLAQARCSSVPSLEQWGIAVYKNGSEVYRHTPINGAASAREVWAQIPAIVLDCAAGDTIKCVCIATSAGPFTVTNDRKYSFIQIRQI
ncbi:hypothetical protein [Novosphingobium mathurense]|uniref:Uncharacterized protein n=1 Tax=Novosphingobium mathurense TaxID=428990 RepID=A0A1U6I6U3_9SPHN|nr:hypothetical protein [Novosphingobium mathurense]SLK03712.1 hypothetical protein SAMN06295987_104284 [Novosphingobium mathurense]